MRLDDLQGVILAGGRSSRFGRDKALAAWKGKTFLQHAADILKSVGLNPAVIARPERDYNFLNLPVLNDRVDAKGPLGGMWTAWTYFPDKSLVVLSCDMPLLSAASLEELILQHRSPEAIILYALDGVPQPFPGIYGYRLQETVCKLIQNNQLSLRALYHNTSSLRLLPFPHSVSVFCNVNTPRDWREIIQRV